MPLATASIVADGPSSWSSPALKRTYVKGREYTVETERELDVLKGTWCFSVTETTFVLAPMPDDEEDPEPVEEESADPGVPPPLRRRKDPKRGRK